jgi:hypothetical protein
MEEEIIPEVGPLLPDGYSISVKDSEIKGFNYVDGESGIPFPKEETLPIGFYADLRLLFKGERIRKEDLDHEELVQIQYGEWTEQLEKIAQNYGLEKIVIIPDIT